MGPHLMRCGRGAASYLSFTASQQQPTLSPKIDLLFQLNPTQPASCSLFLADVASPLQDIGFSSILDLFHPALNTQRLRLPNHPNPTSTIDL